MKEPIKPEATNEWQRDHSQSEWICTYSVDVLVSMISPFAVLNWLRRKCVD